MREDAAKRAEGRSRSGTVIEVAGVALTLTAACALVDVIFFGGAPVFSSAKAAGDVLGLWPLLALVGGAASWAIGRERRKDNSRMVKSLRRV